MKAKGSEIDCSPTVGCALAVDGRARERPNSAREIRPKLADSDPYCSHFEIIPLTKDLTAFRAVGQHLFIASSDAAQFKLSRAEGKVARVSKAIQRG